MESLLTPQDPNTGFISTKLFKSYWSRRVSATHPLKELSELGVSHGSKVTQGGSDSLVQTIAAKLSREQVHRKAGKAGDRANMHRILEA